MTRRQYFAGSHIVETHVLIERDLLASEIITSRASSNSFARSKTDSAPVTNRKKKNNGTQPHFPPAM